VNTQHQAIAGAFEHAFRNLTTEELMALTMGPYADLREESAMATAA